MRKRKAVLYVRVSTDEQAEKGFSLNHQDESLNKHCKQHDIEIVSVFVEDYSAKTFDRPKFNDLLVFLKANKSVDLLLFTKWDRFSRNAAESYIMIDRLKKMNVEPQAIEQPLDFSIPESKIMLAIYVAAPEVDNDRRALNVMNGMRRAKKEGRWVCSAPRGYKNTRDENNKPVIIPDHNAEYVKEGFKLLATELYKVEDVYRMLVKKGFKCSRNNFWLLLRNPLYTGKILIPAYKDEPSHLVPGQHEPLISEALFYQVQDFLDGRRRNVPRVNSKRSNFPLRGMLICPRCGKPLTASSSKGNGGLYGYYHCQKGCKERLKSSIVNERFMDVLKMVSSNKGVLDLYEAKMCEQLKGNSQQRSIEMKKIQERINADKERIVKARQLLLDEKIDADDFREIKDQCQNQIDKLVREIDGLTSPYSDYSKYVDYGFNLLRNLDEYYADADVEAQQKLIGSIFPEKLIFSENRFRTKKINKAVELICRNSKGLRGNKKGLVLQIENQSSMVAWSSKKSNFLKDLALIF